MSLFASIETYSVGRFFSHGVTAVRHEVLDLELEP